MNNVRIDDKSHPLCSGLMVMAGLAYTVGMFVYSCIKFVFVLPFLVLIIIFICNAPVGVFETGKD